jgi:hypothetical protein
MISICLYKDGVWLRFKDRKEELGAYILLATDVDEDEWINKCVQMHRVCMAKLKAGADYLLAKQDESVRTFEVKTKDRVVRYNPKFAAQLTDEGLEFVIRHEASTNE